MNRRNAYDQDSRSQISIWERTCARNSVSQTRTSFKHNPLTFALILLATIPQLAANAEPTPTFNAEIATILHTHCVECHRPGQAAPMSLLTFKEARPWAKAIRNKVAAREMPPWFAAPGALKFRNDPRLSEADIDAILRWADGGAPKGDPTQAPTPPTFDTTGWRLGKPDAVYTMPQAFQLADNDEDTLTRVLIKTDLKEDRWIRAVEVRPGNPAVVHHIVVIAGSATFDGPRTATEMLSVYALGSPPTIFPKGLGKRIPADSALTLSMHYHKIPGPDTATQDQTQVALWFTDDPNTQAITTGWVIQRNLDIAPGESHYESRAEMIFKRDGLIFSFLPHMHYRGSDMTYLAHYPNGKKETLLTIPNYNFNWQLWYNLDQPKAIPKGTRIEVIAHHDNSASNPHNPDPTRRITWGGASTDEMMIGYFDYTYNE